MDHELFIYHMNNKCNKSYTHKKTLTKLEEESSKATEESPVCFTLPHTIHIFSEAAKPAISVDGGARGAILALVARLTDGAETDSSPSDSSVSEIPDP